MMDVQIGHEKTLTGLMPVLAGTDLIYGLGMIDMGMAISYEQFLMDAEFVRMFKRTEKPVMTDEDALALEKRVDKIAEGAALMTETTMKKRFIDGCSNTVPNKTLETLLWKNFNEVGVPTYTEQEKEYAKQIVASYEMTNNNLPGDACDESEEIAAWVDKVSQHGTIPLNDFLVPYHFSTRQRMGSTDVGDVSWLVPTAQINVVTFASKSPGHSWQNVSAGKTSIGHKGLLTAGKVIASTAIELFENPQYIQQAKDEFEKRTQGGYYCPVPKDAVPTIVGGQM